MKSPKLFASSSDHANMLRSLHGFAWNAKFSSKCKMGYLKNASTIYIEKKFDRDSGSAPTSTTLPTDRLHNGLPIRQSPAVSTMRPVTLYGSQFAAGRRSSM